MVQVHIFTAISLEKYIQKLCYIAFLSAFLSVIDHLSMFFLFRTFSNIFLNLLNAVGRAYFLLPRNVGPRLTGCAFSIRLLYSQLTLFMD